MSREDTSAADLAETGAPKRDDVGYKRPPAEHRFKKGQKPPPRRSKASAGLSAPDLLWRILHEEHRVIIGNEVRWMTAADIVVRNAHLLADKGSASCVRLVSDLMMRAGSAGQKDSDAFRVVLRP